MSRRESSAVPPGGAGDHVTSASPRSFEEGLLEKACACGRRFTVTRWGELRIVGGLDPEDPDDPSYVLELRNCHCGSTLVIRRPLPTPTTNVVLAAARREAVLRIQRSLPCVVMQKALPSKRMTPGQTIQSLRASKGITQTALARASGITPAALCAIEHGDATLGLERAKRLAKALEVHPFELLEPKSKESDR